MSERPILFSAPMVRAILDGRKTQTRRVLRPQPEGRVTSIHVSRPRKHLLWGEQYTLPKPIKARQGPFSYETDQICVHSARRVPYEAGDLLWVKEAWMWAGDHDNCYLESDVADGWFGVVRYKCPDVHGDRHAMPHDKAWYDRWDERDECLRDQEWRSSLFMPRWASRITLKVEEVRVQRLQEISPGDAIAEGYLADPQIHAIPVDWYAALWDSLNKKHPWSSNPWVWAVTFSVVKP